MKIAAHELFARKAILNDSSADEDTREHGAGFEAALAHLQHERSQTPADHDGSGELGGSHAGDNGKQRRRNTDPLDADALTEDQVLSATANNPVLAALAAVRGPWQTVYGSGGGSPVASNVRRIDESLTREGAEHSVRMATYRREDASETATEDNSDAMVDAAIDHGSVVSAEAESALIAAQNGPISAVGGAAVSAAIATPAGANVPTLPAAVAQRMIDGTVAALRIDRDTANPQHSASIIEVRHPELGVVRAEVRVHGDAMEVRFEATGAAALLLRASESELRKAVGHHGLRLRNLQIDSRSTLMQERSRRARRHLLDLEA